MKPIVIFVFLIEIPNYAKLKEFIEHNIHIVTIQMLTQIVPKMLFGIIVFSLYPIFQSLLYFTTIPDT